MSKIKNKLNSSCRRLYRHFAIVLMVGFISFFSLQVTPVQAEGFYTFKNHKNDQVAPHKGNKERFFSGVSENAAKADEMNKKYIESGKRAGEVIPKDLGTGSRQKNPVNMLKRAGEELGNDIPKRVVGDNNYERSPIEQELVRKKAARGDFGS
ncbi:hypothetical protein NIES4101_60730 [Calothrix sp. NIES-4101]|nr:hypothetical protein NIES4101_60730 [Calothrix sp. NIES-4101]